MFQNLDDVKNWVSLLAVNYQGEVPVVIPHQAVAGEVEWLSEEINLTKSWLLENMTILNDRLNAYAASCEETQLKNQVALERHQKMLSSLPFTPKAIELKYDIISAEYAAASFDAKFFASKIDMLAFPEASLEYKQAASVFQEVSPLRKKAEGAVRLAKVSLREYLNPPAPFFKKPRVKYPKKLKADVFLKEKYLTCLLAFFEGSKAGVSAKEQESLVAFMDALSSVRASVVALQGSSAVLKQSAAGQSVMQVLISAALSNTLPGM